MNTPCDNVQRFADGELDSTELQAFQLHFGACERCPGEVDQILRLRALAEDLLPKLPAAELRPPVRRSRTRMAVGLALAAGALVVAGGAWLASRASSPDRTGSRPAVATSEQAGKDDGAKHPAPEPRPVPTNASAPDVSLTDGEAHPWTPADGQPELIQEGKPIVYTPEALAAKVQGLAIVKCVITTDGLLTDCRMIQPLPYMDGPILENLATRRYKPRASPVEYVFNIKLVLPEHPDGDKSAPKKLETGA